MNEFDKVVDFIQNHDFAIVVFNKGAKELCERFRKKYGISYIEYKDAIGFRFDLYEYSGYSIYPARCYGISDGEGYYDEQWYSVLSFDKRPAAKVM